MSTDRDIRASVVRCGDGGGWLELSARILIVKVDASDGFGVARNQHNVTAKLMAV